MENELIGKAIKIAKENPDNFSLSLLKRKLHKGIITCNILLGELENLGIIKQHNRDNDKSYWIEVLI